MLSPKRKLRYQPVDFLTSIVISDKPISKPTFIKKNSYARIYIELNVYTCRECVFVIDSGYDLPVDRTSDGEEEKENHHDKDRPEYNSSDQRSHCCVTQLVYVCVEVSNDRSLGYVTGYIYVLSLFVLMFYCFYLSDLLSVYIMFLLF